MIAESDQQAKAEKNAADTSMDGGTGPQPWEEPKLTFLEPTLTKHGTLGEVTAGFFGGFTP